MVNTVNKLDVNRIARNTVLLYLRMLVSLVVNLYSSRIVLNALGVMDFGVYNVVGGVVSMFSLFSAPLSDSVRRFISFEIGTQNKDKLIEVFSDSVLIHLFFALIVILLTESIGYWFVVCVLDIPPERMSAALWVLHASAISIFFSILTIPYRSDVIAHERMDVFAIISLADVFLRLGIAIGLLYIYIDKLIYYAVLLAIISFFTYVTYLLYCRLKFEEVKSKSHYNIKVAKELLSFFGWTMTGAVSGTCNGQGINMILNVFFGPAVNAARGIAVQVQSAILSFSSNIQQAINPQITIAYASGNLNGMYKLVVAGSKYTYLFMFLLSMPIYYSTPYILQIWLGDYPQYTVPFLRMIIIINLFEVLSGPLIVANHATGRIRKYQIVVESVSILALPLSFIYLKFISSENPVYIYYIILMVSIFTHCVRVYIVLPNIMMKLSYYIKNVIWPLLCFSSLFSLSSYCLSFFVKTEDVSTFLLSSIMLELIGILISLYIALSNTERLLIKDRLINPLIKRINF